MASTASTATKAPKVKERGLWLNLMNVDDFIKVYNITTPVTNPIMLSNGVPTSNGILSYEIFGTSQEDRKNRFSYIDLHGHYMNPMAALKLGSYDRKLYDCLFSNGKYRLEKDGTLVKDDEGQSGPEFLYSIWNKVKVKEKSTIITKEVEEFYSADRDDLFITKFPVIPPFTRDINTHTNSSSKSTALINSMYNSIISYTISINQYTDTFTNMTYVTQSRVQQLLVDVYKHLMVEKLKGQPAKFGMISRYMMGKDVRFAARLVISAPILHKNSLEEVQVKFGYATVPLTYVLSCFYPFIVYEMKRFFDANFIEGGKVPVVVSADQKDITVQQFEFSESFDEVYITKLINRFVNSPSSRFDKVMSPPTINDGKSYPMVLVGKYLKDNTTIQRTMTITDLMYIVATEAVKDKHVYVTRYPLDNSNGQWPGRILISSTIKTAPVAIGNKVYEHYPIIEGDPSNSFVDTLQFSNVMIGPMGADFDGDTVTLRPVFTKEANEDCERFINSNAYILNISGKSMRTISKDFVLTAYMMSTSYDPNKIELKDPNKGLKYAV